MTTIAKGQMIWMINDSDTRALHLRRNASDPWEFYKSFPEYAQADPPDFSEGYATFMALLKDGWEVIPA